MIKSLIAIAGVAAAATAASAAFAAVPVFVGYADNLRSNPFFPVPFVGDPGTVSSGSFASDNGAVRLDNNTGAPLVVTNFSYTINGSGPFTVPDLTIPVGDVGIFVLNDSSDVHPISANGVPVNNCAVTCPVVTFSLNGGAAMSFKDSAHVLDTSGYDFAYNGANESFQWRLIGTSGGQSGAPEPTTWALMMIGLGGLGASMRSRRRALATAA